ncbi:protein-glucosylgalactosylhydroxylysine glucosidase-like [Ctenocephalides felis]|uniref:protein-glucosylgalactosylhydroxylysine glucosidase-like n=1 Tax=Ctenocephalides felis TaxID=7515 RepID=UPI000E6E501B|nr:protein-glucosylgalactosylhydroxylysine glucosidase-like [Ctenocephalides felis]
MATLTSILSILLFCSCLKFCHLFKNHHGAELQQSVNLARQEYVQRMCDFYKGNTGKKFEDLTGKDLEHVLIDRERKLLYCYVPKSPRTALVLFSTHHHPTLASPSLPSSLIERKHMLPQPPQPHAVVVVVVMRNTSTYANNTSIIHYNREKIHITDALTTKTTIHYTTHLMMTQMIDTKRQSVGGDPVACLVAKNERLLPTVANGHLGYTLTSDAIYMNGLYNGEGGRSHRARIRAHIRCGPSMENFGGTLGRKSLGHFELDLTGHCTSQWNAIQDPQVRTYVSILQNQASSTTEKTRTGIYRECGETALAENKTYQESLTPVCVYWVNATDVEIQPLDVVDVVLVQSMDNKRNIAEKEILDVLNLAPENLLDSHIQAWQETWNEARIEIEGDLKLAKIVYGSLYYILSSLPSTRTNQKPMEFYGLSPGSLARGSEVLDYEGHNFWDTEIWMFPVILLLRPDLAEILLQYRASKKIAAKDLAAEIGCRGIRFPWESAFTGYETTQPCCPEVAKYQHHITADVSFAIRQYLAVKGPEDPWIQDHGCDLLLDIAEFWSSRVEFNTSTQKYDINYVMGPDEDHFNINNSVYTNVAAGLALYLGEYAKCICGHFSNSQNYAEIAKHLTLLYDQKKNYHPEFQGFNPQTEKIKQADVVLIGYPLQYPMESSTRMNDLKIYGPITRDSGPAMTWAMHSINYLDLGMHDEARKMFQKSYQDYVREPFKVWNENRRANSGDGAVNFLTGMGGFLQTIINGYAMIRIDLEGLHFGRNVGGDGLNMLPENVTGIYINGLKYHGTSFEIRVTTGFTVIRATKVNENKPLKILELDKRFKLVKQFV